MTFHRRFRDLLLPILLLAGFSHSAARAQSIILHLRNGDRLAGTLLLETSNQLFLSTSWSPEITVPVAEIQSREFPALRLQIVSAPAANPISGTNQPAATRRAEKNSEPGPHAAKVAGGVLPANTNTFWSRWKGEASVGLDMERGATDHQLYYGKAKVTYAQPYASDPKQFFRNIFNYDYAYGKTDGTLSDNRMGGSSKTDFDLNRRLYLYNLGAASYDEIRLVNLHYEDGPGAGYHWITMSNFTVNLELGANYQVEDRSDGTHTRSAYGRMGQDLTWKFNKQMTLTEKFEYFPQVWNAGQYRMRFETVLSYALMNHLTLNFSLVDLYDTAPAATVPDNDFQLRTSLGVKF